MSSIFGSWGGDSSRNPPTRTQTASSPDRDQADSPSRPLFGASGIIPSDPPPAHSQDGMNQDDVMSGAMPSSSGATTEQPVMSGALLDTSKEPSATVVAAKEGSSPGPLPVLAEPGMKVVEEVVETIEAPIVNEPDREALVKAPEPIIDSAPGAIQVTEETSTVIDSTNGAPVIVETHADTIEEPTAAESSDSDIPGDDGGKRKTVGAATPRAKATSRGVPGPTIETTTAQPKRRGRPPKMANSTPGAASTKKAARPSATPRRVGRPRKDAAAAAPPAEARSADPPRKRGRPAKSASERTSVQRPVTARTAAPKRRGRPPKNVKPEAVPGDTSPVPKIQNPAASAAPAKRGRPRKADSKPAPKRGRPAAASKPQDTVVEGPKRRGRPPKATTSATVPATTKRARTASPDPAPSTKKAKVEPAPARKRGRPPKNAPKEAGAKPAPTNGDDGAAEISAAKEEPKAAPRGRGRPRKTDTSAADKKTPVKKAGKGVIKDDEKEDTVKDKTSGGRVSKTRSEPKKSAATTARTRSLRARD